MTILTYISQRTNSLHIIFDPYTKTIRSACILNRKYRNVKRFLFANNMKSERLSRACFYTRNQFFFRVDWISIDRCNIISLLQTALTWRRKCFHICWNLRRCHHHNTFCFHINSNWKSTWIYLRHLDGVLNSRIFHRSRCNTLK